ncbi:glycosyltransferase family 61 protein [Acidiphilium sp.]|uniref:glycosyltransferase family 61 protein n=1 Tax=Acidiphilium sp. TaxID=527 RepID=UPI003D08D04F
MCSSTEIEIDPAVPWREAADIRIGSGFSGRDISRFLRYKMTTPTRHFVAKNVTFDPVSGLVLHNDQPLPWSCYFGPENGRVPIQTKAALARKPAFDTINDRRVYCGYNQHFRNYAHWITQCVPAIVGYAREPQFLGGLLLLPQLPSEYEHALRLTGIALPEILQVDSDQVVRVENFVYSSHLQNFNAPSYHTRTVFDNMIRAASQKKDQNKKIYIWRIDSDKRPMVNEIELVEALTQKGFIPVITGSMSIDEQINCFNNAELVVGAHGAGFANIVFCRPGAAVYELTPEHHIDLYTGFAMSVLAQTRSVHYWVDAFPSHGSFMEFGHQVPWSGDISHIVRRVDEIMQTYRIA